MDMRIASPVIIGTIITGVIFASTGTASAAGIDTANANTVAAEVAAVAPVADIVTPTVVEEGHATLAASGSASIPDTADGAIALRGGSADAQFEIGLPTTSSHRDAVVAEDGTVVYADDAGEADVAVQSLESGLRIQAVIRSSDAPSSYTYDFSGAAVPQLNDDGSVLLVAAEGASNDRSALGFVSTPWAFDANGNPVATHYVIDGDALVQIVDHDQPGVAYPVVADPAVSYCTLGGFYPAQCVKFTRAETVAASQLAAGGAGAAVVAASLCDKIGGPIGIACKAAVAVAAAANIAAVTQAGAQPGKCLAITFSYPGIAQIFAGGLRIVNC
jgi:hypothetical protein